MALQFLTEQDIKVVVDPDTFDVIMQGDQDTLERAELAAIEEVSGYLRSRYNIRQAYQYTGLERNQQLLMITTDVMIYHLVSWLPKRLGYEIRETRYLKWIEWLQDVQAGKISPDLPTYQTEDGSADTSHYRMQYGSFAHQPNVY